MRKTKKVFIFPLTIPSPLSHKSHHGGRMGLSLLEVLIALTILVVTGLGLIQALRQSGARGEAFSGEHFTAMFLSQKVMEDINTRIRENPHFFQQLVASATGDFHEVVDGKSLYFKLLENTTNFSHLDPREDTAITGDSGQLYEQLERFKCKVATSFLPDPTSGEPYTNLVDVGITISWIDRNGIPKEYRISQRLYGLNRDTLCQTDESDLSQFSESDAGWALFECFASNSTGITSLDNFMSINGGDRTVVKAFGHLIYFTYLAEGTELRYSAKINGLEDQRDSAQARPGGQKDAAILQEKIAELYEQKASVLFGFAIRVKPAIDILMGAAISPATLGSKLDANKNRLRGRIWLAIEHFSGIPLDFSGAEQNYRELLTIPLVAAFPERRQTIIIRRLLDLQKIAILFADAEQEGPDIKLGQLRRHIQDLKEQFTGREPMFVEYLDAELALCPSVSVLETQFGGESGMSGMIQRIIRHRTSLFVIEDKL